MQIEQYTWDVIDANSWLITEENNGLLIDAVENDDLFKRVKQLESLTVILTHSHFDHIVGLNKIREIRTDSTVISTKLCSEHITNKFRNMSSVGTVFLSFYKEDETARIEPFVCEHADKTFREQLQFDWYGNSVVLSAVYGHTKDGLVASVNNKILFSGDTLLHVPTITRFPTGDRCAFWTKDIPLIKRQNITDVFPGHGCKGQLTDMLLVNEKMDAKKSI